MTISYKTPIYYASDIEYDNTPKTPFYTEVLDSASNDHFIPTLENDHFIPEINIDLEYNPKNQSIFKQVFSFTNLVLVIAGIVMLGCAVFIVQSYRHSSTPDQQQVDILASWGLSQINNRVKQFGRQTFLTLNNTLHKQSDENPERATKPTKLAQFNPASELEQISYKVIQTEQWSRLDMEKFITLWQLLSSEARSTVTNSIWFQQFSFKLEYEANKQIRAGYESDYSVILARKLSIANLYVSSSSKQRSSTIPSAEELADNLAQFLQAYEKGNLNELDALLADNVISNKGTNKSDIRKEFAETFRSSRKRKMTIKNMHWEYTKNHAVGIGSIKTVLKFSKRKNSIETGKIQFVMKKINDRILITHLYQLSRRI